LTVRKQNINIAIHRITFIFGCFYSANQLLVNNIREAYGATDVQMAMMIGALYAGPLLMVLVFGSLSDRIGRKQSATIALLMVTTGLILLIISANISLVIIGYFIYSAGISGAESIFFAITSDINGENSGKYLAFNQALFSIGAMISPIVISASISPDTYRLVYFIIIVLVALILLFITRLNIDKKKEVLLKEKNRLTLVQLIRNPVILLCMATIIISTGSESALTYWIKVFFDSMNAANLGAIALSAYWFASIFGRLLSSKVGKLDKVILPGLIGATIGVILLLAIPNAYLKLIGLMIVGTSFAPIYPALGYKASSLYPQNMGVAFSLITFSSNLGGVISQPVISFVSTRASIFMIYAAVAVYLYYYCNINGIRYEYLDIGNQQ